MRRCRSTLFTTRHWSSRQTTLLITVTGGKVVYELCGISCLPLELVEQTGKGIAIQMFSLIVSTLAN
jgi:hypothetical protein